MELTVTRKDHSAYTINISKGELSQKLLNQDLVTITVVSAIPIEFNIGDSIQLFGNTYTINRLPKIEKRGNYYYEVEFEGQMYALMRAQYLLYDNTGIAIESDFSYMATLEDVIRLAVTNLNRVYGDNAYQFGECPNTAVKNHIIQGENVLAVLQRVCNDYGYEFELKYSDSIIINAGSIGEIKSISFRYGAGKGLYKLERQLVQDKNLFTRLYAYGGTKNLKPAYRNFSRRLKLPGNDQSYIQDNNAINALGLIEATKIFDDIYPHRIGTVTAVTGVNSFVDNTMDFDLNAVDQGQKLYLIPGNPAKIHFNTGNLAGYEFELASYDNNTKTFTIKSIKDDRGYQFPSTDSAFSIGVGDEYVIVDIYMPQTYIDNAEQELYAKASALLAEGSVFKANYTCDIDPLYAKVNEIEVIPGDYIHIVDEELAIDRNTRVISLKRDIIEPYKWTIELGDQVNISITAQLLQQSLEQTKIININQLKDPVKYRNSWRTALELQQLIFDQDGYFDTMNIRPLSINTAMLSVGSKAGQFVLNGIVFEPGYNGVPNRIRSTAGILSHYAIMDTIKSWNISAYDYLVPDNDSRYIYARCEINGTGGEIRFRTEQLKVDEEPGYYNFLIGVLHSLQDNYRKISLTYGSTIIHGKDVRTGRISSQDGLTYFDLDAGEIGGKIVFRSGKTDIDIENNISQAQATANQAQAEAAAISPKDSSLTLRYRFDSDSLSIAADESINKVNGVIQGTRGTNWDWTIGKKGKGIKIISDAGGITVAGTSETTKRALFKKQEFTISGWVKLNSQPAAQVYGVLFDFPYYNTHSSPYFCAHLEFIYLTTQNILVRGQYNLNGTAKTIAANNIAWATWGTDFHHIAFVFKDGLQKLYVDGVEVASDTQSGTITYTDSGIIRVGGGNSGYAKMADWVIDEVRYDARALTAAEILGLYKGLGDAASKTTIDGGLITTGNIILKGSDGAEKAGITAEGGNDSVRIWAGETYTNRASAPFRALQDGTVIANKGYIGGWSLQDDAGGTKLFKALDNKFLIDADNQIIAVRDSNNNDKLVFQAQNLPLLSALQATSVNGNFSISDTSFTGTNTITTNAGTITPSYDGNIILRAYVQYTANVNAGDVRFQMTITAKLYNSSGTTYIKTIGSGSCGFMANGNSLIQITGTLPSGAGGTTYTVKYEVVANDYSVIDPEFNNTLAPGNCIIDWNYPNNQYSYTLTYSRALSILATNGIVSYWSTNKYFYLSSSDASYFLQFKGNAIMYAPSGNAYFNLTDSAVRIQITTTRYLELTSSGVTILGIPSGSDTSGDWGYVKVQPSTGRIYYKTS